MILYMYHFLELEFTLYTITVEACCRDRALDSRSEGLGFDLQCWLCVEVLDKLLIQCCLYPASSAGYLAGQNVTGSSCRKYAGFPEDEIRP